MHDTLSDYSKNTRLDEGVGKIDTALCGLGFNPFSWAPSTSYARYKQLIGELPAHYDEYPWWNKMRWQFQNEGIGL